MCFCVCVCVCQTPIRGKKKENTLNGKLEQVHVLTKGTTSLTRTLGQPPDQQLSGPLVRDSGDSMRIGKGSWELSPALG